MPPYWDSTPVTFYRPDGDTEGKDIGWCRSHGFYEIEEGFWSGDWYYEHHPEEKKDKKAKKRVRDYDGDEDPVWNHFTNTFHGGVNPLDDDKCDGDDDLYAYPPYGKSSALERETRFDLLDTIYGGCCPASQIAQARKELAKLDGTEIQCPIGGCSEMFLSQAAMQRHLNDSKGLAHISYREEHNISLTSAGLTSKKKPRMTKHANNLPVATAIKAKTPKTKPSLPKSADIRSFFKPKN